MEKSSDFNQIWQKFPNLQEQMHQFTFVEHFGNFHSLTISQPSYLETKTKLRENKENIQQSKTGITVKKKC